MNKSEAIAGLKLFNCNTEIVQTNHPRYAIGFIEHEGVSIGKIVYVDGKYCHIKWYTEQKKYWLIQFGWTIWKATNTILTKQHLDDILIEAEQEIERQYAERQQWREDNPATFKTDKEGNQVQRKRKALQRRKLINVASTIAFTKYEVFA